MAKRYLHESGSDDFDRFLGRMQTASISHLTVLELRCLLARRRRNHDIDTAAERRVSAAFEDDVAHGFFEVHPLEDQHAIRAGELLMRVATIPLRTLDALHLAIATAIDASSVATADETVSAAATFLRIPVEWFGGRTKRRR